MDENTFDVDDDDDDVRDDVVVGCLQQEQKIDCVAFFFDVFVLVGYDDEKQQKEDYRNETFGK